MARFSMSLLICLVLTGCANTPKLPSNMHVEVADVVDNIRCELSTATTDAKFLTADEGWTAGVDLQIGIIKTVGLAVNADLSIPLNSPTTLSPGFVATEEGSADRTVAFGFQKNLKTDKYECDARNHEDGLRLNGSLGVFEWLELVQRVIEDQRTRDPQFSPGSVSTTIKFSVTTSGGLGAAFSLIPISNSSLGAGAKLGGSKLQTHTLTVTLTKNPPPSGPQEVVIVSDNRGTKNVRKRKFVPTQNNNQTNYNQQLIDKLREVAPNQ